jgi:hypothetical protein
VYTNMRVYPRHINASRKKLSDPPHRLPSAFAAPQQLLATRGLGARLRIWGSFELVRWSVVRHAVGPAAFAGRRGGGGGVGMYKSAQNLRSQITKPTSIFHLPSSMGATGLRRMYKNAQNLRSQ